MGRPRWHAGARRTVGGPVGAPTGHRVRLDLEPADADGPAAGPGAPPPGRSRRRSRPVSVALAVVAVVLLGALLAPDRPGAGAAGGQTLLGPLARAPAVLWATPDRPRWSGRGLSVLTVDDTIVVLGRSVRGLDPRTGAIVWEADVPGSDCHGGGPFGHDGPLYCYTHRNPAGASPPGDPIRLVAIDPASGAVLADRELAGTWAVDGGPGLRIVRAWRVGLDAEVRMEDAATGRALWADRVPFASTADPGRSLGLSVEIAGVVRVSGTGIEATYSLDGLALEGLAPGPVVLPGGLHLAPDGDLAAVETAGGRRVAEFTGRVVPFAADDGTGGAPLLIDEDGMLTALDPRTGTALWSTPRVPDAALVRVGEVGVLADAGAAVAVDLSTGRTLWTRTFHAGAVTSAFTDGTVAVAVVGLGGSDVRAVALAPRTGQVRWSVPLPDGSAAASAVDGFLATSTGGQVTVFGPPP